MVDIYKGVLIRYRKDRFSGIDSIHVRSISKLSRTERDCQFFYLY